MSLSTPRGWVSAALVDVAHWSSGGTPSRANPKFFSGTIPWIKTGELGPQFIRSTEEYISEDAIAASSAKVFPKGAVALAMYGATIGKASILAVDASTNQACAVGVPDTVSSEFLYYFLLSQREAFVDAGKGGAQPNISQGIVKDWPILVPPLAEQARIVEKLEELLSDLEAGVAELKAAQRKLAQYRQSLLKAAVEGALTAEWRAARARSGEPRETGVDLLQRILTERRARWEAKQLAKYADQGKTPPKGWQAKYPEPEAPDLANQPPLPKGWAWASVEQLGEVQLGRQRSPDKLKGDNPTPYIRAANITEIGIDLIDVLEMDFSPSERETFALKQGDILLTEASGSAEHVGRPAIWTQDHGLYCFQNTVLRFTPNTIGAVFSFFSFLAMQKLGVFSRLSGGVGINHLSAGKFSKLPIALPPITEQQAVVDRLRGCLLACDQQNLAIETSLKQAAAQRKNILKAAFTGQLVPQNPSDEPANALLERIRAKRASQTGTSKPRGRKPRTTA